MGVEVSTDRLWQRADERGLARLVFVNMLDRERADFFRTLDSLKDAFGPHVGRDRDPDRRRARDARHRRPDRHEGLRVRGRGPRQRERDRRSRTRSPTQAAGVPREADGRGRRELRRADGALPRGRGDLPRRDRRRAQGRRHARARSSRSPAASRRRTSAPTGCSTRSSRTCPRRPSKGAVTARDGDGQRGRDRARRGRRAGRLRLQDAGRPVRRPHQPVPRLLGRREARLAADQRARPLARSASASCSSRRARRWATRTSSAPATSARSRS